MNKLDIRQYNSDWKGLWYNKETHRYSSAVFNVSDLRDFKGNFRFIAMKNSYHKEGDNRPNMVFKISGVAADDANCEMMELAKSDRATEEVFTRAQVMDIIRGTHYATLYGSDYMDILPEDYASPQMAYILDDEIVENE